MKKAQRYTIGAIVEIPINKGEYFCYGQLLDHGECAVFDYRTRFPIDSFSVLEDVPTLFRVAIYRQIISQRDWVKVGALPIRQEYKVFPDQYIYHEWDQSFYLYKIESGEIIPATKEQCYGLECCMVWDSNHVEDRIVAHYDNEPCPWLKEHYKLFPI